MAANTINIDALVPIVPVAGDPLQQIDEDVGHYGTTAGDVIIPNAQPSVQRNPLPQTPQHVPFDNALIPWNRNPIDRNDLPVAVPIPDYATFTNRNKLLSLLRLFMIQNPQQRGNVVFQVSRVGETVYYLDGPLGEDPGPMVDANGQNAADQPGRYGIPFENLVAANVNPNLEKYFVFQSYSLFGVTQLLVRTEVDCLNQTHEITEIKSRQGNPNNNPVYFRGVWAQMLFGCTQSLVIGYHTPQPQVNNQPPPTNFTHIITKTFPEVTALAGNNDAALRSLASLILWIRDNIADGETRGFSFATATQKFTLTAPL